MRCFFHSRFDLRSLLKFTGQPTSLWRPQQFYTGRVGVLPQEVPDSTALDGGKETRANGKVESLLASSVAEKAVRTSQPEPAVHPMQTTMTESTTQAQHSSIPEPDVSSQKMASSTTVNSTISQHDGIPSIVVDLAKSSDQESLSSDAPPRQDTEEAAGSEIETMCGAVDISTFAVEDPHMEEILRANDDSKMPHFFTVGIHASVASHAPTTTIPIDDSLLFALEA